MRKPVLLPASDFCRLVDIDLKRFEQRRLRERAVTDLAESIGIEGDYRLPIAPTEPGKHARFDALDAIRMRAVMELERGGLAFNAACQFIISSGISGWLHHVGPGDYLAAQWLEPGGLIRRISGTENDIARAMPAAPLMAIRVSISAVAEDIARRAKAQRGLIIDGAHFYEEGAQ